MRKNQKIIFAALCLAMRIALSQFLSIKTPLLKISFAFAPTSLSAIYLGWKWTCLINVLGDLIGALFFSTGPYFIGYTITAGIAGVIYGLLLYQDPIKPFSRKKFILHTIFSVFLVAIIINLGLNTLCTSIVAGRAFLPLLGTRFIKECVMIPIQIVTIVALEGALRPLMKQHFYQNLAEGVEPC